MLQLLRAGGRVAASSEFLLRSGLPQSDHLPVHSQRRSTSTGPVQAGTRYPVYPDRPVERDGGPASPVGHETAGRRDPVAVLPAQGVRSTHGRAGRHQIHPADTDIRVAG